MGDVSDYHQGNSSNSRKVTNSLGKSKIRSSRNSFESSLLEGPISTNGLFSTPNPKQSRSNSSQGSNSTENRATPALRNMVAFDNSLNDPLLDNISPLPSDRIHTGGERLNSGGRKTREGGRKTTEGGLIPSQSPRLSIVTKHALANASLDQLERAIIDARKREMNGNNPTSSSSIRPATNINRSHLSPSSHGVNQSYTQSKLAPTPTHVKNAFTGAGNSSFNPNREYPDRPVSRGRYSGILVVIKVIIVILVIIVVLINFV
jgi:hypothetical protein